MNVNRCLWIVIVAVLFMSPTALSAGEEYLSGTFVDQEGNVTKISKIKAQGKISGKFKGQLMDIEFAKLKMIEKLGNGINRVTNQEGKQFLLENAYVWTQYAYNNPKSRYDFFYYFFDEISLEEVWTKTFKADDLREVMHSISFGDDLGRLKFNSRTKEYFPPDYIFDPFTGEELTWSNPEY